MLNLFLPRRAFISIHALVKRATFIDTEEASEIGDFNPRPREEGDELL